MSPRSKKRSIERPKRKFQPTLDFDIGSSRLIVGFRFSETSSSFGNNSLVDETTETESENYTDSNESKQRKSHEFSDTTSVDHKLDYENPLHTFTQATSMAIAATLASSQANQNGKFSDYDSSTVQMQNYSLSTKSLPKVNIWYGTPSTGIFGDDEYSSDNNHLVYNGGTTSTNRPNHIGFATERPNQQEKKIARYDYRSFIASSNPKSVSSIDSTPNGGYRRKPIESEFADYQASNSVTVDDDTDHYRNTNQKANKYDWPYGQNGVQNGNNSFKTASNSNNNNNNETISLDVDDEKMIGILV